jgi:hypothetical protein
VLRLPRRIMKKSIDAIIIPVIVANVYFRKLFILKRLVTGSKYFNIRLSFIFPPKQITVIHPEKHRKLNFKDIKNRSDTLS